MLTRRFFLQSLACFSLLSLTPVSAALANDNKTLVLYFSRSGNTRQLATMIHNRVGGDIVEIKPLKPYPEDYNACVDLAKQEQKQKARPKLAADIPGLNTYHTIFIGYPNWWGTMPMLFFTLLEANNMAGKTLVPFCTHGGSNFGNSLHDLKKLCPKARIVKGLAITGTSVAQSSAKVDAWLSELGLKAKP